VQPLGALGRRQLADCFLALASLKRAMGKGPDAELLERRAQTARKDPSDLSRHRSAGPGWDNHAWLRLQADEAGAPSSEALAEVRRQLRESEDRGARRRTVLGLLFGGLAGLWVSVATGIPGLYLGPVGAALGFAWARRQS